MNYTNVVLFLLGMLGLALHCLSKINSLKKTMLPDGKKYDFKIKDYLEAEWASMGISIAAVIVAIMLKEEVRQLDAAGKWLGLGFVGLGFMAQSILVTVMGKYQAAMGIKDADK